MKMHPLAVLILGGAVLFVGYAILTERRNVAEELKAAEQIRQSKAADAPAPDRSRPEEPKKSSKEVEKELIMQCAALPYKAAALMTAHDQELMDECKYFGLWRP